MDFLHTLDKGGNIEGFVVILQKELVVGRFAPPLFTIWSSTMMIYQSEVSFKSATASLLPSSSKATINHQAFGRVRDDMMTAGVTDVFNDDPYSTTITAMNNSKKAKAIEAIC